MTSIAALMMVAVAGAGGRAAPGKQGEPLSVKDFGALGDGVTDDTAAIQAAIDRVHNLADDTGIQGRLALPRGAYVISAPLRFGKNIEFVGEQAGFASVLKPSATFSGAAAVLIDGSLAKGGYAFRQLHRSYTVDCSLTSKALLPITFKVNRAYSIKFEDVWVYNGRGTAWDVYASNDISFVNARAYGASASPSASEFGIRLRGSGGTTGSSATLIEPDIESWFIGISQEGDADVTLISPYLERNIRGWQAMGNTGGYLTVSGGLVASPGKSGGAAYVAGPNVTVVGGRYVANGGTGLFVDAASRHANVRLINPTGDITDNRNRAVRDMADSDHWYPSAVRNFKTVTSGKATGFYSISMPPGSSGLGVVEVVANARDSSGASIWSGRYRVAFDTYGGSINLAPVVEYAKSSRDAARDASLSLTVGAVIAPDGRIRLEITATVSGASGRGRSPQVSTDAELVQWDPGGSIYLEAL